MLINKSDQSRNMQEKTLKQSTIDTFYPASGQSGKRFVYPQVKKTPKSSRRPPIRRFTPSINAQMEMEAAGEINLPDFNAVKAEEEEMDSLRSLLGPNVDLGKMKEFAFLFGEKRELVAPIFEPNERNTDHTPGQMPPPNKIRLTRPSPVKCGSESSLLWKKAPQFTSGSDSISGSTTKPQSNTNSSENKRSTFCFAECSLLNTSDEISPRKRRRESDPLGDKKPRKAINYEIVRRMLRFLENIDQVKHFSKLFTIEELEILNMFVRANRKHQFFCMKLFLRKIEWYNIFSLLEKLQVTMEECEVRKMYDFLKENKFVDTNYMREENIFVLLNSLDKRDLQEICHHFKFLTTALKKEQLVKKLLNFSQNQITLTARNSEQILREKIEEQKGICIRISQFFYDSLYKVYIMNTFAYPELGAPVDYLPRTDLQFHFPNFTIEDYDLFRTKIEFYEYAEAVKLRHEFDQAQKDPALVIQTAKAAFDALKALCESRRATNNEDRPPYLERYTAFAKYASILTSASKTLTAKCHHDVQKWLSFLISQKKCNHKIGFWYNQLLLIHMKYLRDYKKAVQLFIECFESSEEHLTESQKCELAARGKMLLRPQYKLTRLQRDQITMHIPSTCDNNWPEITIEKKTIRQNSSGNKRMYVEEYSNGEKDYLTVEETALEHYRLNGFPEGVHTEGRLIVAAFILLFYDCIYEAQVPAGFISKMQNAPTDMYSKHFYINRESLIKERLIDIESRWTPEQLQNVLVNNFQLHSQEALLLNISTYVDDTDSLFTMLICLGRYAIAKIFDRLAINFAENHSGFPDLIVWNTTKKIAKMVEVKGEGDELSKKQAKWLEYFINHGVAAEVCHVHSIGSKSKRKIPRDKK